MSTVEEALLQKFGRDFPTGTVLFQEGEAGAQMYVIHAGRVRISKDVRGRDKVLSVLGQGEFFGEMSILNDKPRSATATVLEDARLLVIDRKMFESMILHSTEIALRMVKRLAARLQEADDHIENLMLRDPTSRVVHHLVRQARLGGTEPAVVVDDLPSQLALRLEEVRDAYGRLERKGLVKAGPETTRIIDLPKLEQFLEFLEMREQFGDD